MFLNFDHTFLIKYDIQISKKNSIITSYWEISLISNSNYHNLFNMSHLINIFFSILKV
jgi:hypothetical protein